jgi:hypothetical protein
MSAVSSSRDHWRRTSMSAQGMASPFASVAPWFQPETGDAPDSPPSAHAFSAWADDREGYNGKAQACSCPRAWVRRDQHTAAWTDLATTVRRDTTAAANAVAVSISSHLPGGHSALARVHRRRPSRLCAVIAAWHEGPVELECSGPGSQRRWGWGAIVSRHRATQSLLKRSITSINQSSSYRARCHPTDRISFASRFRARCGISLNK